MGQFSVVPTIHEVATCKDFVEQFKVGAGDLVITNEYIYKPFFGDLNLECETLFQEKFGSGEPSDEMVEAMYATIKSVPKRIIAIGGGTVIDIAKLFALKQTVPILDLYDGKVEVKKDKPLILIPTTCGTGSEVTNISILALISRGTKKGLANAELFANDAVLIPELLKGLPFKFFATSSIDALIHAIESSLSPKATSFSKMFGYKAIEMILKGYMEIRDKGQDARIPLLDQFLLAATYAGIAFGNAGCAAVHALSYPLGATYHVPHGESNYALFTGVMKNYMEIKSDGKIAELNAYIAGILGCSVDNVYEELDALLGCLIPKKALHEYGMKEAEIVEFTDSVIENQQRLLANNFVFFDRDRIIKVYTELF